MAKIRLVTTLIDGGGRTGEYPQGGPHPPELFAAAAVEYRFNVVVLFPMTWAIDEGERSADRFAEGEASGGLTSGEPFSETVRRITREGDIAVVDLSQGTTGTVARLTHAEVAARVAMKNLEVN